MDFRQDLLWLETTEIDLTAVVGLWNVHDRVEMEWVISIHISHLMVHLQEVMTDFYPHCREEGTIRGGGIEIGIGIIIEIGKGTGTGTEGRGRRETTEST